MEDPFIYGPDGIPISVKAPRRSQLTRAELHDVIVAVRAHNRAEAHALVEWLHEAHIPALQRAGGTVPFGEACVEILVPRKLAQDASATIALFRQDAKAEHERHLLHAEELRAPDSRAADHQSSARHAPLPAPKRIATLPPESHAPVDEEWVQTPVEEPRRKPSAFQLAQRGTGAALLTIGGSILVLEFMMNGLRTPLSLVALSVTVLGLSLTIKSLGR